MDKQKKEPLEDFEGFLDSLQKESPRAAAIIAGAFLDAQLRNLLSTFLIDDPKEVKQFLDGEGALSTFASRIKAAYCLGLIGRLIYSDLNKVREIRNKFAHKMHDYSFEEAEVVKLCESLQLAKMVSDAVPHLIKSHQDKFLLGVVQLSHWLSLKTIELEQDGVRRISSKDPKLGMYVRTDDPKRGTILRLEKTE